MLTRKYWKIDEFIFQGMPNILAQWQWKSVISGKEAKTKPSKAIKEVTDIISLNVNGASITRFEIDHSKEYIGKPSYFIDNLLEIDPGGMLIGISFNNIFELNFMSLVILDNYSEFFIDLLTYSDLWMSRDINGKKNKQ